MSAPSEKQVDLTGSSVSTTMSDDKHDSPDQGEILRQKSAQPDAARGRSTSPAEEEEVEDDTALGRLATATSTLARGRSNSVLPPPPDGGLQAWTQVAAGWLVLFSTWGWLNSFGAFQSYYTTTLLPDVSPSAISWIGSLQACLTTCIGAFTGRLLDAGFFRATFATGVAFQLTGLFAMSAAAAPKYWHLMVTQGLLTGLGGGILFTPSIALVATWFSSRRGLAIGLVTTGNSAGGIIYPVIVRELIPRIGFQWTARVLGFVNLTCFSIAFALLRSRLPPRRSGPILELAAFKEGVYVSYVFALFLFTWANYYVFYYIASFGIQQLGMPYAKAALLVMIINGAGIPARIVVPLLSDRVGPLNMITLSMICLAVIIACWAAVSSISGLFAFTAVLGVASGAFQSLMPTTVASITKRLDTVGTRLGMAFSVASFASLTGPPIGGAIQATGGITAAQVWAALSAVAAAGLLLTSRWFRAGWVWRVAC
ncbi:major facilitator superfamily domain-containing protein [Plectosphaerella plurivora]|uniref:Major facilitator superfamily domain-containing protein n=1 Tax=Plectosphaerella plurivora TaxID=936078 RepID=A0A9P8V3U1_9PEZI|nr:major facilitator superfamily domain-containing protein [Plectosphaerella plurivora]